MNWHSATLASHLFIQPLIYFFSNEGDKLGSARLLLPRRHCETDTGSGRHEAEHRLLSRHYKHVNLVDHPGAGLSCGAPRRFPRAASSVCTCTMVGSCVHWVGLAS